MPKVSAAYVVARRQEILTTASELFSERGFAQTSMADICAKAGLSAGAIYRYFPSKNDLVLAICRGDASTESAGGDLGPDDSAVAMVDRMISHVHPEAKGGPAHARLVSQIYGDAAIRAELATVVAQRQTQLRDALTQRITEDRAAAPSTADYQHSAESVADVVLAGLAGYAALVAIGAPVDHVGFRRTLISLLDPR